MQPHPPLSTSSPARVSCGPVPSGGQGCLHGQRAVQLGVGVVSWKLSLSLQFSGGWVFLLVAGVPAWETTEVSLSRPSHCHTSHWWTILLQHRYLREITVSKWTMQPLNTTPNTAQRPQDSLHPRRLCILNLYLGKPCLLAWHQRGRGSCNTHWKLKSMSIICLHKNLSFLLK